MLNKVPEVTVYFWIIKILCTTVGETAADYLNENLGFGLDQHDRASCAALLVVALVAQFRARRYVPGVYWLAVVLISVVGTLITDNLTDNLGVAARDRPRSCSPSRSRRRSRSGTPASAPSRSTRSSRPGARRSTGWPSSSPSPSAPRPATSIAERFDLGYWKSALIFGGADRRRRTCAHVRLRAERDPRLLARLHPHPAARRVDRRLPVAAARGRRPRPRHDRDQRDLPGDDPGVVVFLTVTKRDRIEDEAACRGRRAAPRSPRPRRRQQDGRDPALVDAVRERAAPGRPSSSCSSRTPPTWPSTAPAQRRHEGEQLLAQALPPLEQAAGSRGRRARRRQPERLRRHRRGARQAQVQRDHSRDPADHVSHWLHVDLAQRIAHLGYPLTTVTAEPAPSIPLAHRSRASDTAEDVIDPQVFVLEDDAELRSLVAPRPARRGVRRRRRPRPPASCSSQIGDAEPDALVVDIGLPDADGRDVVQALRAQGVGAPVIFLTARDALPDRLAGFAAGGDDYLTKPFAFAELVARLRALIRRGGSDLARRGGRPAPRSRHARRVVRRRRRST